MRSFAAILVFALAARAHAENQCPSEQAEDWNIELLLPHNDCDKFYKCTYGHPIEQDCPLGLQYNTETQQCDYPTNVECGERYVPGEVEAQPDLPVVVPEAENQPEDGDTPIVVPEAENQPEIDGESDKPIVVEPDTEEDGSVEEIVFLPNGCPEDFHVHWLVADEEDCNKFYSCIFGEKVQRACTPALHFNAELQVCDYPERAGCSQSFNKHIKWRNILINRSRM